MTGGKDWPKVRQGLVEKAGLELQLPLHPLLIGKNLCVRVLQMLPAHVLEHQNPVPLRVLHIL